jgi:hypothetical protein
MTHGRNPPSHIEIGAMRINRFAEQTKLETYGAPCTKPKNPRISVPHPVPTIGAFTAKAHRRRCGFRSSAT